MIQYIWMIVLLLRCVLLVKPGFFPWLECIDVIFCVYFFNQALTDGFKQNELKEAITWVNENVLKD